MSYRKCDICKGSGVRVDFKGEMIKCINCNGLGVVSIPAKQVLQGTLKSSFKNEALDFCAICEHHHCVCINNKPTIYESTR
jgi:hypothetical protein